MTDNEIVKALEICTHEHLGCEDGCPFIEECGEDLRALEKAMIGLIKNQKTEIENLTIELQAMRGAANSYKAEVERLQKKERAKCGTCAYSKPTTFGKSKCYVECTNQEHIMQFCRYREISLKRQRTTPACKRYKEMVGEKDV